ncbi:MAG: CDP-diacylglycerol--glycerol-3-phosphate 3-phosphatidyltransferase [Clostridia bacterium]|nr:CDP-diacylglycerol--glycerol-3-phosphate 3-phosphatidyltransferase [Clostridia bacterium]MDD4571108.1 CDP-diacylglycerol--glycerol-3-phosphate 3-phosphatidyltransferase [Clostridia bacterium]
MNLANKITLSRICLIPVFILITSLWHNWVGDLFALIIFLAAACTDGIDGYIARSRNQITTFGKFIDPLADKLLMMAAFVALVANGRAAAWIVIVILAREFAVTGLRTLAVKEGIVIAASSLGKIKTVTQIIAVALLYFYTLPVLPNQVFYVLGQIMLWIALFFTLYSGWDYFVKSKKVFKEFK